MKIQLFSSYARDTGNWVRACNMADALRRHAVVDVVPALPRSLPFRLDIVLSFPWYLFKALGTRADILIASKPFPNTALPLLLAGCLRGKKVVVDIDDLDSGYLTGLPARIIAAVQKPFPRCFDLVTYHHDNLRRYILRRFGVSEDRLYRLRQGVDLTRFRPSEDSQARSGLFFMGHLDVASCLGTILRAVAIVQAQKAVDFTVVGGGRLDSAFRAWAATAGLRVRFTGPLPVDRIPRELDRADICLVYHDETEANAHRCSMKVREYLAMKKKVVSNGYGDLGEFESYTYQSSSRVEAYARAILGALDGGDGRERAGAVYVREQYDWAVIGARFHERLLRLMKSDGSGEDRTEGTGNNSE